MVVILVDALGAELADATPGFAASLGHRRRLETVLGFSSGALPTLFSGRGPGAHGRFLMYRRRADATVFRGFGMLRALPRRLRESGFMTRALTRLVERRGVRGYFNLYQVPRALLEQFDLPERADIFAPGGLPVPSLWDTIERSGLAWRGWNWRTREADNARELDQALETGDESFLLFYTADLDARLHVEGSRGPGVKTALANYDRLIEHVARRARARGEEVWIYLLSDHGMVDVIGTEDVMARLEGIGVGWPADYLAFFDSTMARFWWREGPARERERVRAALAGARGRWLEPAELESAGVNFPDHRYGDDIFLLDPGVLMVPSFMGRGTLAGMHGYDPSHPDMAALLWSNRPIPGAVRRLGDVRAFLESEIAALARGAA
jgi:hypothetical protein